MTNKEYDKEGLEPLWRTPEYNRVMMQRFKVISLTGLAMVSLVFFVTMFNDLVAKYGKANYKNVVLEKKKNELWIEDIKTKEQRVLEFIGNTHSKELEQIQKGDTIEVKAHKAKYDNDKVISLEHVVVISNYKLQRRREQQRLFDEKVKKMQKEK